MNRLHRLQAARLFQCLPQQILEGILLLLRRFGHGAAKYRIGKFRIALCCIPGVIQCPIDIGAAVIKGGEQKPQLRRCNQPFGLRTAESILYYGVAQRRFAGFYRTNAAQHIGEYLVRGFFDFFPV